jgi:hypothetical protein
MWEQCIQHSVFYICMAQILCAYINRDKPQAERCVDCQEAFDDAMDQPGG